MDIQMRTQQAKRVAELAAQGHQRGARSQTGQLEALVDYFEMALLKRIFRKPRLWLIILAVLIILLEHTPLVSAGMIWSG